MLCIDDCFIINKRGGITMVHTESTIGFIGVGVMGKSMAKNLQDAGYMLNIYTRTKDKALPLIGAGMTWKQSVSDLAQASDIIITMVGYPDDVREVYFGDHGIINNAKEGTYVIDMTTSQPQLAIEIDEQAKLKGLHALDAPVSGGDVGAKNGTLSIMIGGKQQDFDQLRPVFEAMGENIILQGPTGSGQYTKLANQITIASNMVGVCEAIVFAKQAGLDPSRVLDSIQTGGAGSWTLSNLAPRMINEDYAPGFFVKHFIKDMTMALESAEELGLSTPGLALSLTLYKELADMGENDSGTQALIKLFEAKASV